MFGRHRNLIVSYIISGVLHLAAAYISLQVAGVGEEKEAFRIRFIAPPPILKKSFELVKKPEISEVQMQMLQTFSQPQAPTDIARVRDVAGLGTDLLRGVAPSMAAFGTFSGVKAEKLELEQVELVALTEMATSVQEAASIKDELFNVGDLDTGRYNATIILPDLTDKRSVTGYFNMTVIEYNYMDFNDDRFPIAVDELMRYIRDYTNINAQVKGVTIELADRRLFKAPFIYMTGQSAVMQLSETEIKNLGEYLRNGGFLFADDIVKGANPTGGIIGTPFDAQMKKALRQALGTDAKFVKIPNDHKLYTAFYDFPDGPPLGGASNGNVFNLEGIWLRGRLAVVFSDLNISWYWGDQNAGAKERGLQFGVNLIVYALTQPGGLANVSQYTR